MEALIKTWEETSQEQSLTQPANDPAEGDTEFDGSDPHGELTEFPADGSSLEIIFFLLLFPLRFLMHWTINDVRTLDETGNPTATIGKAYLASVGSLIWLIVGSYAMVASLENLAELMDIPDAVIGVTVSAAGTSLPNYVASKVAAQNGFGVSSASLCPFVIKCRATI